MSACASGAVVPDVGLALSWPCCGNDAQQLRFWNLRSQHPHCHQFNGTVSLVLGCSAQGTNEVLMLCVAVVAWIPVTGTWRCIS